MLCPFCGADDDRVIDSRSTDGGKAIRRRRACNACDRRFTTYERLEETSRLTVIKSDGSRTPFDPEKLLRGLKAACGKRPIPEEAKRQLVEGVEEELYRQYDREVESRAIGEKVATRLRGVDPIAYVRFASEYYRFENVGEMAQEIEGLSSDPGAKEQQHLFGASEDPGVHRVGNTGGVS